MDIAIQWPLLVFSLLAGGGGALFAFAALSELTGKGLQARLSATITALVMLAVGGCASVLHLASPQNVMAAAANLGSFSGISVELIMLGATFAILAAYAILLWRGGTGAAPKKVLAVLGLVSGLVLAFVCGHGYLIDARACWNTELLPLAYAGSVLPVGGFAYLLIEGLRKVDVGEILSQRLFVLIAVVLSVVSVAAYVVFLGLEVAGRDPAVLYGGIVACGMAGCAVCAGLLYRRMTLSQLCLVAAVGLVASLVGAVSLRMLMWLASDGFANLFALASTTRVLLG